MKRGDGESTRCLCLGTVTPMPGDVLGDSISPSTYSSCMTALGSMQGGPGKGCSAMASAPLQHPQPGRGRLGRLQCGTGSWYHFSIPNLCSKGHHSSQDNCSHSLQERD